MSLHNTNDRYGFVSKIFHWVMFLMIVCLITVGFVMTSMEDSPDKIKLFALHKSIGLTIIWLILLRTLWALSNIKPALPDHVNPLLKCLAQGTHVLLYILLLAMPISGWILSCAAGHPPTLFGWVHMGLPIRPDKTLANIMADVHETLAWTIIVIVSLHICGAFYHHFIYKDNVLKRMLPCCGCGKKENKNNL